MRNLRLIAAGALLAGVSGCSINQGPESAPQSTPTWVIPYDPTTIPSTGPAFQLAPADTSYIDRDADINFVYIAPEKVAPVPVFDTDPGLENPTRTDLVNRNPRFLATVSQAFSYATYGRYDPKKVSVEVTPKIDMGCISASDSLSNQQDQRLQALARPYNVPGELNVIVFDQYACNDPTIFGVIGGFEEVGGTDDPMVDRDSLSNFLDTVMHETGHDGGLIHAGTAECNNPVTISECDLNPVADPLSVMDYADQGSPGEGTQYTYPELGMLGLLKKDEVLAYPKTGVYTLTPMGEPGLKVIEIVGDNLQPVYLSFEADPSASYDEKCIVDPNNQNDNDPDLSLPNLLFSGTTNKGVNYVCLKVDLRELKNSLQVRTDEYATNSDSSYGAQGFLADVIWPARISNSLDESQIISGQIKPSVIYDSSTYSVVMLGVSNKGAVIKIVNKQYGK